MKFREYNNPTITSNAHNSSGKKNQNSKQIYSTGLTNEFNIINLKSQNTSSKNIEIESSLPVAPLKTTLELLSKPNQQNKNENLLIRNFKRRFEMQKCSSTNNLILKAPPMPTFITNSRISLSPIENKLLNNNNKKTESLKDSCLNIKNENLIKQTDDLIDLVENQPEKMIQSENDDEEDDDANNDQELLNSTSSSEEEDAHEDDNESDVSSSSSSPSSSSPSTSSANSSLNEEPKLHTDNNLSCCECCCSCLAKDEQQQQIQNNKKRIAFKNNSQLVQQHNLTSCSVTDGFKIPTHTTHDVSTMNLSNHVNHNHHPSSIVMTPPNPHISSFTSSFLLRDRIIHDSFKSPVSSSSNNLNEIGGHANIHAATTSPVQNQLNHNLLFAKTPKTIKKRGAFVNVCDEQTRQVFGTPDYLSPELLMGEPHNESVDWWALGVCMYEFLIGITPFADQTPELIFENILQRIIEWPEGPEEALSANAMDAIMYFLKPVPGERMRLAQMKQHELFKNVNWNNLLNEQPPFVPRPDHSTDTCYFETRNEIQNIKMSDSLIRKHH
jgi:hypothetical protein